MLAVTLRSLLTSFHGSLREELAPSQTDAFLTQNLVGAVRELTSWVVKQRNAPSLTVKHIAYCTNVTLAFFAYPGTPHLEENRR